MDFAQEVKAAADIVTVIGHHVRLKQQGGSRFVGLCPFHQEKTPSFSVHGGLQFYKCFGCGKSGDVFNFLMEIQGLTFFEALKSLAEDQGLEMPRRGGGPGGDAAARKRSALLQIHELAQKFYAQALSSPRGRQAMRYLRDRGLGSAEIQEFGIGYAPPGNVLVRHLKNRNLKRGEVLDSGLIGRSERDRSIYDRFRDRLMFPIHSDAGKIIAYGGRIRQAEKQPKYLNSPETKIYRKNSILYNLHRARTAMRQNDAVILVEGYMDVIGVWRAGIRNAVAPCGTALTSRQIGLIRRHCDTVIVNFDSDRAGRAAAERSVELLLKEGLNVRVLELPDRLDPDDFCKMHGGEAYRSELDSAPSYFYWLLDRSRKQFDLYTAEGRAGAFERLLPPMTLMPDAIKRTTTAADLAEHIGIEQGMALQRLRQATGPSKRPRASAPKRIDGLSASEQLLIMLLVGDEGAREELLERAHAVAQHGLPCLKILSAMLAVHKSGDPFQYVAVEGRLEDQDRGRLARLVFDKDRPRPQLDEGRVAVNALHRRVNQDRLRHLARKIKRAERRGKHDEVLALLARRVKLEQDLAESSVAISTVS